MREVQALIQSYSSLSMMLCLLAEVRACVTLDQRSENKERGTGFAADPSSFVSLV